MTIRDPGDGPECVDCARHGRQTGRFAVYDPRSRELGNPRYRCRLCMREASRRYYARRYRNR